MSDAKERARRNFGGDQKAAIVRRHLADKVPVSDLADEYQVQPSLIYLWIRQVLEQAERAFQQPDGKRGRARLDAKDRRIAELEDRVARLSFLRDWQQSDKPSRHDAATRMAGCPRQFANDQLSEFQFPLNQDSRTI